MSVQSASVASLQWGILIPCKNLRHGFSLESLRGSWEGAGPGTFTKALSEPGGCVRVWVCVGCRNRKLQFEVWASVRRWDKILSFLEKPLPFECRAQRVSDTNRHLTGQDRLSCLGRPCPTAPRPTALLERPGNDPISHPVGLGSHGCSEHRSEARQRQPLGALRGGKRDWGTGAPVGTEGFAPWSQLYESPRPVRIPVLFPAASSWPYS